MPESSERRWMGVDEGEECRLAVLAGSHVTTLVDSTGRSGWSLTVRLIGCLSCQVLYPLIQLKAWLPLADGHVIERSVFVPYELFELMKEGEGRG